MSSGKKEKNKKQGGGLGKFFLALIMAIIVFIALLVLQTGITQKYEKQGVVVAKQEITANVDITKENLKTYFTVVDKDVTKLTEGVIKAENIDSLVGCITKETIAKGQEITPLVLYSEELINDEIRKIASQENLVETSFTVASISDANAGTLRRGDIIDITIYYTTSETKNNPEETIVKSTTLENVYIAHAYDGSGLEIVAGATTPATMFKIVASEDQVTTLNELLLYDDVRMNITKTNNVKF